MSRTRSSLVRRTLTLESLEERWTPAAGSISFGSWLHSLRNPVAATTTPTRGEPPAAPETSSNAPIPRHLNMTLPRPGRAVGAAAGSHAPAVGVKVGMRAPAATAATIPTPTPTPNQAPTPVTNSTGSTNDAATTVPANVSGTLAAVYRHALDAQQPAPPSSLVIVSGDNVGVAISGTADGDFDAMVSSLRNLGMQIQSTSATYHAVRGMLPISQIPTAAAIPQVLSISALTKPRLG